MSDSEEDAHDRADDSLPSLCAAAKVGDLDRVRAFLQSKSVDVNAPKGGVGKEEEERVCERVREKVKVSERVRVIPLTFPAEGSMTSYSFIISSTYSVCVCVCVCLCVQTPLHFAAEGGHIDCVWALINAGADINAKTV